MNRTRMVAERDAHWKRLRALVNKSGKFRGARRLSPPEIKELSELYRSTAADLMQVRRDRLGPDLEQYLHGLSGQAHNLIYARSRIGQVFDFWTVLADFPGALRRNWRLFLLANLVFYGPFIGSFIIIQFDQQWAELILGPGQMQSMESMYAEAPNGRDFGTDAAMTAYYIFNNVGIAFRCFATGIFFGGGSLYFMFYNGLMMGTVFGHLFEVGLGMNLLTFVSSHSSWELTAIVISGAAGLQLGYALVRTNGRTRLGNLQSKRLELLRQISGAAVFLGAAALIEAWISPSALPQELKFFIGGAGWILVMSILIFGGRNRAPPEDVLVDQGKRIQ